MNGRKGLRFEDYPEEGMYIPAPTPGIDINRMFPTEIPEEIEQYPDFDMYNLIRECLSENKPPKRTKRIVPEDHEDYEDAVQEELEWIESSGGYYEPEVFDDEEEDEDN